MKCDKCQKDFLEKELDCSHDIPKYMGGDDSDGRHWLCKKCHNNYELEVIKMAFMNLVKKFPDDWKRNCRYSAIIVNKYFFKNDKTNI